MSWDHYTKAVVRMDAPCGSVWVHPAPVGEIDGSFPDPDGRSIFIITAHNPEGLQASAEENRAAHARLMTSVVERDLEYWPAVGGDPTWAHTEISLAVLGLDEREARQIGREFGQEAIFVWTPSSWVVLGCQGSRRVESGWRVSREASERIRAAKEMLGLPDVPTP